MDATSFSFKKIKAGLQRAKERSNRDQRQVRVLFSPETITEENFEAVCDVYSDIEAADFQTVVVVESSRVETDKKLAMPSFKTIKTTFGEVQANEKLRNDFADEDDDFFITDTVFNEGVSLYQQLLFLQCILDDFTVLHIQITDEKASIMKELVMALREILPTRRALLVCCCDLAESEEVHELLYLIDDGNFSGLMNRLNRKNSTIDGALVAGLSVSKKWGLSVYFDTDVESEVLQSGYAAIENQLVFR